jgi:hypothetical protein
MMTLDKQMLVEIEAFCSTAVLKYSQRFNRDRSGNVLQPFIGWKAIAGTHSMYGC